MKRWHNEVGDLLAYINDVLHPRKAEDGPIDPKYPLKESSSASYLQRTEWNVRDSDTTVYSPSPPN